MAGFFSMDVPYVNMGFDGRDPASHDFAFDRGSGDGAADRGSPIDLYLSVALGAGHMRCCLYHGEEAARNG